jgi:hypothetical protein
VNFPSQVRGNILDLILSNVPERVVEIKEMGRLEKSDHVMIKASIDISRKEVNGNGPELGKSRLGEYRHGTEGKKLGKIAETEEQ